MTQARYWWKANDAVPVYLSKDKATRKQDFVINLVKYKC